METFIADSANIAAPAPYAASAARAALADAIAVRRAADDRAAAAAEIAGRADALLRQAHSEVARLQAAQQEAERITTETRASAISAALRAGEEPPAHPFFRPRPTPRR